MQASLSHCRLQKYSQPKSWELCFIWREFLELQAWEVASHKILRKLLQGGSGGRDRLYRSLQQKAGNPNLKRLKENQICQVEVFSAFLYMGRCKSLGSWKSFLWYTSQLKSCTLISPELYYIIFEIFARSLPLLWSSFAFHGVILSNFLWGLLLFTCQLIKYLCPF